MTLAEIEAEIIRQMARLGRDIAVFRFDRVSDGFATPHVEGDGPTFDWVIAERGIEQSRKTLDAEGLIFETLNSMTARMALDAEMQTRRDNYSRATWMNAHISLMAYLRPDWGGRVARHYQEVLRFHPLSYEEERNARGLDIVPKQD